MIYAVAYIVAIVLANLSISIFGPASAPINAFLLIGAVLTLRDLLHARFGPWAVVPLIAIGTALSALLGPNVARIAWGGAGAFFVSEVVDTGVYHLLRRRSWVRRVNYSNFAGAFVDSVLFFPLAFGIFPVWLILGQWAAKFFGGFIWALVIDTYREKHAVAFMKNYGKHPGCEYGAYRVKTGFYCNKCGFFKPI